MKDPIYAAYDQDLADARARAGDTSPEAIAAYANQQVAGAQAYADSIRAQREREAARAAAAQQQQASAMGMTAAAPQAAQLAYNPDTHTLMVNGQAMPHDIQAWGAA